jgi:Tfp pilus assembly PilM family ATPase
MVRSIGIDPGDRGLNVVALEGNYRKVRLVAAEVTELDASDESSRAVLVADAVRESIDTGMKGGVILGHPCREAVLRTLELPFKGAGSIRKVVKSEIEAEIFTHSVEEMVVDFHEIGDSPSGGTKVLVAALPKDGLRDQLDALKSKSVDAAVVDLDTMALWRVADWVGAFEAGSDQGDAPESGDGPVHAVIDLGARSVKVILTEGDQLAEMRVLRLGDSVVSEQLARTLGIETEQARRAAMECLRTGGDVSVNVLDQDTSDDADAGSGNASDDNGSARSLATRSEVLAYCDVEASQTKYLQRLARELTRFLAASGRGGRIQSLWVSGVASGGVGVSEMLQAVFGVEPQALDVFAHMSHDYSEEEAQALSPSIAISVGLALSMMGGPPGFDFRQEDLSQGGGFDRIKFPLAIACMVSLFVMFVFGHKKIMEKQSLELELGQLYVKPDEPEAKIFHGHLNTLFPQQRGWLRNKDFFSIKPKSRGGKAYVFNDLIEDIVNEPVTGRLKFLRDKLRRVAEQKQKESGVYEDVALESGLAVLVRWSEILKSVEPQLGRYLVPDINLAMSSSRKLIFEMALRGKDFRRRAAVVERAYELELGKPDTPFTSTKNSVQFTERAFTDGTEKGVPGAYVKFTWEIKKQFSPFGPSGRVGALLQGRGQPKLSRGFLADQNGRRDTEVVR